MQIGDQPGLDQPGPARTGLQEMVPAPHRKLGFVSGRPELYDALAMPSLQYKAQVPFEMYQADAVLSALIAGITRSYW